MILIKRKWKSLHAVCLLLLVVFGIRLIKRYFFGDINYKRSVLEIQVEGYSTVVVDYEELLPVRKWNLTVVLLHENGIASNWESIDTPKLLKGAGYRVLSLRLPTIADTISNKLTYPLKGQILYEALEKLRATDAVLVVPSLTGSYGLPVVLRGKLPLNGFVPIAPVATEYFTPKEYKLLEIPTLIIIGSYDQDVGVKSLRHLKLIKQREVLVLSRAGHECYIDQPEEFHKKFLLFLLEIQKKESKSVVLY